MANRKTYRVVVNSDWDGFHLTDDEIEWVKQNADRFGIDVSEGVPLNIIWGDYPRHSPLYIECLEALGEGTPTIVKIHTNKYYIEEHDGYETVITEADFVTIED